MYERYTWAIPSHVSSSAEQHFSGTFFHHLHDLPLHLMLQNNPNSLTTTVNLSTVQYELYTFSRLFKPICCPTQFEALHSYDVNPYKSYWTVIDDRLNSVTDQVSTWHWSRRYSINWTLSSLKQHKNRLQLLYHFVLCFWYFTEQCSV